MVLKEETLIEVGMAEKEDLTDEPSIQSDEDYYAEGEESSYAEKHEITFKDVDFLCFDYCDINGGKHCCTVHVKAYR